MTAMTLITLQAPLPQAALRVDRPTPSAHDLPAVAAVAAAPDTGLHTGYQDKPAFVPLPASYAGTPPEQDGAANAPQPFPDIRFADPLPNLPELDLPTKAAAYQAALSVVRQEAEAGPKPAGITD
jgi:hypothetical protein